MGSTVNRERPWAYLSVLALLVVGISVLLTLKSAAGQDITWTVQFGTTGDDEASELAVDGSGNVYVVGSTFGTLPGQTNLGGADSYLSKYGPDGAKIWTRQFGTEEFDVARAIVVDVAGNLYVVGSTAGTFPGQTSLGNIDAYLRKYDANGVEAWTRQFGSDSFDFGQDVAIDGAGNLYVAGSTWGAFPGETDMGVQDAFVRKYDSDGIEVWTHQFGTIGFDEAASLGVDDAGNVYVTGWTDDALPGQTNAGLGEDVYLRKYDRNGFEIWTRQFGTEGSDLAVGVVVRGNSGVFVVGYTDGALPGQASSGSFDAYLRSYDADGLELWTRQFGTTGDDLALSVAADDAGDLYVVGATEGTLPGQSTAGLFDAIARKFDGEGVELWTIQFGTEVDDFAWATSPDDQGNLYVAGDTDGAFPSQTSSGGGDVFVAKLSGAPSPTSPQTPTPTSTLQPTAPPTSVDTPTPTLTPSPTPRMIATLATPTPTPTATRRPFATTVPSAPTPTPTFPVIPAPSPTPTPTLTSTPAPPQAVVPEAAATATPKPPALPIPKVLWTHQFGTAANDTASQLAVDQAGDVFVVGSTWGSLPGQTNAGLIDAYVGKFDSDGTRLWMRQFGTRGRDRASSVAVGREGNLYVVGWTERTLPGLSHLEGQDAFIRKYDTDGAEVWTRQFGTTGDDFASGVGVDGTGNLYVVGTTLGTFYGQAFSGNSDAFVRKYDGDGMELWTRQFGTREDDQAFAVTVDGQGDLYIAGRTGGALPGHKRTGREDTFVVKYDDEGHELWNLQFGSPRSAGAFGVGIDGAGDVYVAGETGGAFPGYAFLGGRNDAFLVKISGLLVSTSPDNPLPTPMAMSTPQPIAAKATPTVTPPAIPLPTATTGIGAKPAPTATVIAVPIPTRTPTPETAEGGCTAQAGGGDTVNAGWLLLGLTFPGVALLGLRRQSAGSR